MSRDRKKQGSGWTRRQFLERVGQAGGAAALFETMTAMGLINKTQPWAGPLKLSQKAAEGKSVLILGAGIGGLTTAFELNKIGAVCTVLEANDRAGGRSYTVRNGDLVIEESQEHGLTEQECGFDEGLYLNLGPGRLPYHHRRVLHYCKILDVLLEPYIMNTTANLYQNDKAFGGESQLYRRMKYDTQGYISELLAKAVRHGALDHQLDEQDREALLSLLKNFGQLGATDDCTEFEYCGSTRSGCRFPLSVYEFCEPEAPLPFRDLLRAKFWNDRFYQPDCFEWQPTLFQPVGGMDEIWKGFLRALPENMVQLNAAVTSINILSDGVQVEYEQDGVPMQAEADYCVSNIPLPVLQQIPANFTPDFKQAVDATRFAPTCKVGWQANQRFWESDKYEIYGGISWVNDNITQIWYPTNDYFTNTGTLTGAYNFSDRAIALGEMSLQERLLVARNGARKVQPEFGENAIVPIELGLSIAWQNVPYQLGGWADWNPDSEADRRAYERLLAPDGSGRFYIVGDQVSPLPGWQEGAMISAEHVVEQIVGRRLKRHPPVRRAPDSRSLTDGR